MSETIQSLSICCPARKCINHCATCTARQHDNPYANKYSEGTKYDSFEYWNDVIKRMKYAQSKGCTTVMLTGSNEPQQDRHWLEGLWLAMQSLDEPFLNIEMQTTGAFIDYDYLKYLKAIGLTTLAVSVFSPFSDLGNKEIEQNPDRNYSLQKLCDNAAKLGLNVRICINVTDFMTSSYFNSDYAEEAIAEVNKHLDSSFTHLRNVIGDKANIISDEIERILNRCSELHANQVTFRKMWSNPGTAEAEWIHDHCKLSNIFLSAVSDIVQRKGNLICKLPYGAARYDYNGFSIVVDVDSMAKDENNINLKYYIIRENGKMYSSWDSPASLVF